MKRIEVQVGKLVELVQRQARKQLLGQNEHVKAIIALHNYELIDIKFSIFLNIYLMMYGIQISWKPSC